MIDLNATFGPKKGRKKTKKDTNIVSMVHTYE